jgi:tRNA pseudouridine55 synthase
MRRKKGQKVDGWLILDKPVDLTSTQAVNIVRRIFDAQKAGHAGTLDPLASGILPIALGEATKTVPFVMDGRKSYVFTVAWGVETDTDDAEGRPVTATNTYPERDEVEALLSGFTGTVEQIPPRFSAIKIKGERAYDLARDGEMPELAARTVQIDRLALVAHHADRSILEADCGKGTYVRALARDLGRTLGCLGHVAALRRTRVGPFAEEEAVKVGDLEAARDGAGETLAAVLRPVESALSELPSVAISRDSAARLMRGQPVILRGREAPLEGKLYATCGGVLVAVGDVEKGELVPHRVFNLGA